MHPLTQHTRSQTRSQAHAIKFHRRTQRRKAQALRLSGTNQRNRWKEQEGNCRQQQVLDHSTPVTRPEPNTHWISASQETAAWSSSTMQISRVKSSVQHQTMHLTPECKDCSTKLKGLSPSHVLTRCNTRGYRFCTSTTKVSVLLQVTDA